MAPTQRKLVLRWLTVVVVADLLSKALVVLTLPFQKTVAIWPGVIELYRTVNPGVGSLAQRYLAATGELPVSVDSRMLYSFWLLVPGLLWVHRAFPVQRGVSRRLAAAIFVVGLAASAGSVVSKGWPVVVSDPRWVRTLRFVVVLPWLAFLLATTRRRASSAIVTLLLACGVGNTLNGLLYGPGIVDFLWFPKLRGYVGVMNLADLASDVAMLGAVFYLPYRCFFDRSKPPSAPTSAATSAP